MSVERFEHYDRETRGRRVLMALVKGVIRRLSRGRPTNWASVHRRMLIADPSLKASASELRLELLCAIDDVWSDAPPEAS